MEQPVAETSERGKIRYLWAVLLSLFGMGAGQIYAGRWRRGVTIAAINVISIALLTAATHIVRPSPATFLFLISLLIVSYGFLVLVIIDSLRLIRDARAKSKRPWTHSVTLFLVVYQTLDYGFFSLRPFGWHAYSVPSASNQPTLLVGDQFFADQWPAGRVPHRGDMMVFLYPRDKTVSYVKRIIGLPGDTVQIKSGRLFINNQLIQRDLPRDYEQTADDGSWRMIKEYRESLPEGPQYDILKYDDDAHFDPTSEVDPNNTEQYKVPPGTVFVLGDNRDNSSDSRFLNDVGYVPIGNLVGRATMLYFSWDSVRKKFRWDRILTTIR